MARTRDALLTYLRIEPRPLYAITRYMYVMHRVSPAATRQMLYRLRKEGLIERADAGIYRAPA